MPASTNVGRILEWDSDHFGTRIGRVNSSTLDRDLVARIDTWCADSKVSCVYLLARADDERTTRLAAQSGYQLMDQRVEMSCDLRRPELLEDGAGLIPLEVRPALPEDVAALEDIAAHSYHDSRFYFDPLFPTTQCDSLYRKWIARSCDDYAARVITAGPTGSPIGYVTCDCSPTEATGSIGLVGVGDRFRGQGIGKQLINVSLRWFVDQQLTTVTVVTQGRNIRAIRTYERCGFLMNRMDLWYHKWFL